MPASNFVDFMLDDADKTLVPGQNVQLVNTGNSDASMLGYQLDTTILGLAENSGSSGKDVDVSRWGVADVTVEFSKWTHGFGRHYYQTLVDGQLWVSKDIGNGDLSKYAVFPKDSDSDGLRELSFPEGSVKPVILLKKKGPWGKDERRAFYWSLVESAYPHLKGLKAKTDPLSTHRADAATIVAMLELGEELKYARAKAMRTSDVTEILAQAPPKADDKKVTFCHPLSTHEERKDLATNEQYKAFYDWLWSTKIEPRVQDIYTNFLAGKAPQPQVRVVAVGDGGGTRGLLGKLLEGIGLAPYNPAKSKQYIELTALPDGQRTVVHMLFSGLDQEKPAKYNGGDKPVRVQITGGGRTYTFEVELEKEKDTYATVTPTTVSPSTEKKENTITKTQGTRRWITTDYTSGAAFDGNNYDFSFAPDAFTGTDRKISILVTTGNRSTEYEEMLFGACLVGVVSAPKVTSANLSDLYASGDFEIRSDYTSAGAWPELDKLITVLKGTTCTSFSIEMLAGGHGKKDGELVTSDLEHFVDETNGKADQALRYASLDIVGSTTATKVSLKCAGFTDHERWIRAIDATPFADWLKGHAVTGDKVKYRKPYDLLKAKNPSAWASNDLLSGLRLFGLLRFVAEKLPAARKKVLLDAIKAATAKTPGSGRISVVWTDYATLTEKPWTT